MKTSLTRAAGLCALLATTCLVSPAAAEDIIPPKVYTMSPGGVNMSDGSFIHTATDFSIGPLTLERFSLGGKKDPNTPAFGPGMSHNFDIWIAENYKPLSALLPRRYKPVVHLGTSASGVYLREPDSSVVQPSSIDAQSGSLTYASGAYTYITQDGTVYTFDPAVPVNGATVQAKRVASIVYPGGRTLTFSYDSGRLLRLVRDSTGYAIVFEYNGSGLVSAACGYDLAQTHVTASSTCASASLKTTYGYTAGLLTSATDLLQNATTYSHQGKEIACVTPPGHTSCKVQNTYGHPSRTWQVTQQTFADGSVWNYTPNAAAASARDPLANYSEEPNGYSQHTDPDGKATVFSFVQTSPYSITDPLSRTTGYRFKGGYDYYEAHLSEYPPSPDIHEGSLLVEATMPEGDKYLAEYGGPYNSVTKQKRTAKPGSNLEDLVVEHGYGSCAAPATRQNCTKPIWTKDARGNQTDFTYESHGGIRTEMGPPVTPPSGPGPVRPVKIHGYAFKYANVKNASGTLVANSSGVWLPVSVTECQTVANGNTPECDPAAPQTVTEFEYRASNAANNLLLRGKVVDVGGLNLRTCYTYDALGNKISETAPEGDTGGACT